MVCKLVGIIMGIWMINQDDKQGDEPTINRDSESWKSPVLHKCIDKSRTASRERS